MNATSHDDLSHRNSHVMDCAWMESPAASLKLFLNQVLYIYRSLANKKKLAQRSLIVQLEKEKYLSAFLPSIHNSLLFELSFPVLFFFISQGYISEWHKMSNRSLQKGLQDNHIAEKETSMHTLFTILFCEPLNLRRPSESEMWPPKPMTCRRGPQPGARDAAIELSNCPDVLYELNGPISCKAA